MNISYSLFRKKVKRATLRIYPDLRVVLTVPNTYTDTQINAILTDKKTWIVQQLETFKTHPFEHIPLQNNELLLFGKAYRYEKDDAYPKSTHLDHVQQLIKSKKNLLHLPTQTIWYKKFATFYLPNRTLLLAQQHQFICHKITVRNQKTRWGSCSIQKNISLNWKLIKTPTPVIDYVILHELVHTLHFDHSKNFWNKVQEVCPYYKQAKQWLKTYSQSL